jgi:aryl-alcohol dehydrogenase-like predicted oxidoreductase
MEQRTLGDSGLLVTPIGLGLAALGRPGYINLGHADDLQRHYEPAAMAAQTMALCDTAWAAGIRYFDVARSYGCAEEFLGAWLRARAPDRKTLTVGSKWGYTYTAGWLPHATVHEVKEHSLERLRSQWVESQAELGTYLSLYQIHSATLESGVLERPEVLAELARIKAGGVAIGLSVSGARQAATISRALQIRLEGRRLFDVVQATWNLLEPSAGSALAEAYAAGMGVIVKEAVANGRLTPRNLEPAFAEQRVLLTREAARLGCSLDALALAAALAQPWSGVVLSGAATVAQLHANLAALTVSWDEQAAQTLALLAEPAGRYWQTRAALPWN